ncbi:hypothetical protein SDC9_192440 [bioreactor metagenome]|uniref:Uncharacterized protein n=1 Tax=bioreactor metagenome TaxID=1076179 RepID=A0A645IBQ9_9ZZZZ
MLYQLNDAHIVGFSGGGPGRGGGPGGGCSGGCSGSGLTAGGQAQGHGGGQSQTEQLLFHDNNFLSSKTNQFESRIGFQTIKSGPVQRTEPLLIQKKRNSVFQAFSRLLRTVITARKADLGKVIEGGGCRQIVTHAGALLSAVYRPDHLSTLTVYSFKQLKSTVILHKISLADPQVSHEIKKTR